MLCSINQSLGTRSLKSPPEVTSEYPVSIWSVNLLVSDLMISCVTGLSDKILFSMKVSARGGSQLQLSLSKCY